MHQVGIALSGGGTRGIVHIGVLQALEDHGITPTIISGTSAGSIVGVLYAHGYTPKDILDIAGEHSLLRMFALKIPNKGFARHSLLRKMLSRHIPENSFEELKKPLYVAIANLNTGKTEIISSGPLADVIIASSSIPVLYEPIQIGDYWYADGGLLMNLPLSPIRPLARYVIGVNLIPRTKVDSDEVNSIIGVAARTFSLAAINTIEPELKFCDTLIEPAQIAHFSKFNFKNIKEMYEIGYTETEKAIPRIKEDLKAISVNVEKTSA